jgi:hypothetical protein
VVVVIQILAFIVPLVVIAVVVHRIRGIARMVQDPEQLAGLLSPAVRDALIDAGIDPTTISLADLETNEELKEMVSGDLRAAIMRRLTRLTPLGAADSDAMSNRPSLSLPSAPGGGHLDLPPPIDGRRTSDGRRGWILAIVVGGAVAALAMYWR